MHELIYQGKATFFDGNSASSREGVVEVSEENIFFREGLLSLRNQRSKLQGQKGRLEVNLPVSSICEVLEKNGNTRIVLAEGEKNSIHQTLILPVLGIQGKLHGVHQKMHKGSFQGLVLAIKGASWQKKIGFGLGLAIVNLSLYFTFLYQAYHFVPTSFDLYVGRNVVQKVLPEKQCKNEKVKQRIQKIVTKLVPEDSPFEYKIHFVDHPMVNAFAVPGGDIVLFNGMLQLADSEEEIAGVLAHEIAHVEQRHSVQSLIRLLGTHYLVAMVLGAGFEEVETLETIAEVGSTALFLKYSREFEEEADRTAILYLHKNEVSLKGFQSFFAKLPGLPSAEKTHDEHDGDKKKTDTTKTTVKVSGAPQAELEDKEQEKEGESTAKEEVAEYAEKLLEFVSTHPLTSKRIAWLEEKIQKETFHPQPILPMQTKWKKLKQVCTASVKKKNKADTDPEKD